MSTGEISQEFNVLSCSVHSVWLVLMQFYKLRCNSLICIFFTRTWLRELELTVRAFVSCVSVTFVRPTQQVKIYANVSTPFGTVAIHWPPTKILRALRRGLSAREAAKYSDFGHVEGYIWKRCKIWCKLLLITNRKSYMSYRLVPKLVTLNDLERHIIAVATRNSSYFVLFHRIW